MKTTVVISLTFLTLLQSGFGQYGDWQHGGSLFLLTTLDGAQLPAEAEVKDFPVLVRLDKDWFDFQQADQQGRDIRFSAGGTALAYQLEAWDQTTGNAAIWVRIPVIRGNAQQEIRMHWGKAGAAPESDAKAVFNESNGYASVWHMSGPVVDDAGGTLTKDEGTTPTVGVIGQARHFEKGQGIFGGDQITAYPSGTGPVTTEAWFRAGQTNGTVLAWGEEKRPCKIMFNFLSPPRIAIQCYFADVEARTSLATDRWYHVVHTYSEKDSRVYVNGELDGTSTPVLDLPKTSRLWIGGWYGNYHFVGDIDEVRISHGVRSADWIKLQYGNQKPLQRLVGPLVKTGDAFALSSSSATVPEGKSATFTVEAPGARKIYWTLRGDGQETLLAVDRFSYVFEAGRVTADKAVVLQCKAVYHNEVRTGEVAISIKEAIEEPKFTLTAPAIWDGRSSIGVTPQITNLKAMEATGAAQLKTEWSAGPFAVIKEANPDKLVLLRSQNSGDLAVSATVSNGGEPVTQTIRIKVTEPKNDAWINQTQGREEKPVAGQFYARDNQNEGVLHYNGVLTEIVESVFLKTYADGALYKTETLKPGSDQTFAFNVKLKPGLIKYKVEFGATAGGKERVTDTVDNLVCGDAYIIEGHNPTLWRLIPARNPRRKPTNGFEVMAVRPAMRRKTRGIERSRLETGDAPEGWKRTCRADFL